MFHKKLFHYFIQNFLQKFVNSLLDIFLKAWLEQLFEDILGKFSEVILEGISGLIPFWNLKDILNDNFVGNYKISLKGFLDKLLGSKRESREFDRIITG